MEKKKEICKYREENNKKDLALKIGVGIASIALIGGTIAAIITKIKKDNK